MNLELLITIGYALSVLGFLGASFFTLDAMRKASASGLKTVLTYLFVGMATFFFISIFQSYAEALYGIDSMSIDVWWHVMFYLAMFSFYLAFKSLTGLATSEADATAEIGRAHV